MPKRRLVYDWKGGHEGNVGYGSRLDTVVTLWTFPCASSFGSDFNFDFNVSITEEQQREGAFEYDYQRSPAQ